MLPGIPIITERLIMNAFAESDAPFVNQLLNTEGFHKYIGDRGVRTDDEAAQYIKDKFFPSYENDEFGFYIVRLRHMDFPIGMCGIIKRDHLQEVDLGFAFLDEYMGQGYAQESSRAVMEHANEYHDIDTLIAVLTRGNTASRKLLERLGFTFEKDVDWPSGEVLMQYVCNMYKLRN